MRMKKRASRVRYLTSTFNTLPTLRWRGPTFTEATYSYIYNPENPARAHEGYIFEILEFLKFKTSANVHAAHSRIQIYIRSERL